MSTAAQSFVVCLFVVLVMYSIRLKLGVFCFIGTSDRHFFYLIHNFLKYKIDVIRFVLKNNYNCYHIIDINRVILSVQS